MASTTITVIEVAEEGCTDPSAINYDEAAEEDDGSCEYDSEPEPAPGCTDPSASNYDEAAEEDDGSCEYEVVLGCIDEEAVNYNEEATDDDGSCTYKEADESEEE